MSRFFAWKAWLFGAGLVVGLAGMIFERRPLVWVAVALLGTAFMLRLVERRISAS